MYCRNCGKELEDTDKFCKYCGIDINNFTKNNLKDKLEDNISMRYFKFFVSTMLTIIIIINILSLFSFIQVKKWDFYTISLLLLQILLYVVLPLKLKKDLPKRTTFSFGFLIAFLILDYIYKVIMVSLDTYLKFFNTDLITNVLVALILYGCWFIPNLIYFFKRKRLFIN